MEEGAKPDHSARGEGKRARTRYHISSLMDSSQCVSPATMTSRRIISSDKNLSDKDENFNTPNPSEKSVITPAVPAWVNLPLLN